ncbi:hypothetical protein [Pontivivens ytuae]|uniref:Lipoprotein n=1 Tax=Pontivivens ytuae TaxID=2789856 RepID=A0A7S9LPQ6_9RHOB|nr:hypothetical protein [Pontivivens ytuae]QPH53024.1 hypothetical protein I0K15_14605 [Pontivivens ytuae]
MRWLILAAALAACAPMAEPGRVVLAPDGLVVSAPGRLEQIPFGTPREQVEQRVSETLGTRPVRSSNPECGGGPAELSRWAGLELLFRDGAFDGWFTAASTSPRSPEGIGVGVRETTLREAYATEVQPTSLGREFSAEGFSGLIDGGEVSALWAGTPCLAR